MVLPDLSLGKVRLRRHALERDYVLRLGVSLGLINDGQGVLRIGIQPPKAG